ncbi:MAG: type III polyketide synthase [Candidatus Brocadiaceae bacterium]|nr:type III polyketide synthase [Candidatus Brocadiaceae bacterium]
MIADTKQLIQHHVQETEDIGIFDRKQKTYPKIISVGTANPPQRYRQEDVVALFKDVPKRVENLFKNCHIENRFLYLPEPGPDGKIPEESNQELIDKHLTGAKEIGKKAIEKCLSESNSSVLDIDHLLCVSSTGFLCPGISAHIVKTMGFREDVHRIDILGMGCNAGLNSLQTATALSRSGHKVLLLCVEICSAAYTHDGSIKTGVVNSLFGDGAAAILIASDEEYPYVNGPKIIGYQSMTMVDVIDLMKFELTNNKLSFSISKETPYIIGLNVEKPVYALLDKYGLKKRDIRHWIIHSGGKKVLDSIKYNLDLTSYDIRNTSYVLQQYGNISSCSVFFSLNRLQEEGVAEDGDLGVAIAMGPGAAIETALLQW